MKLQRINILFFILLARTAHANPSIGDSAAAVATQTIVHRLQIKKISDLNFGESSPGDGPRTISADGVETRENASFEIEGEPFRNFQIVLPEKNSVKMVNGSGGVNGEIIIQEFNSIPARSGIIGATGKAIIFIGASRKAISINQKIGVYSGQFYVTVVY